METTDGLRIKTIAPGIILTLLLSPVAYCTAQDTGSNSTPDRQSQTTDTRPTPEAKTVPTAPNAKPPVPPQPSDRALPDSPGAVQTGVAPAQKTFPLVAQQQAQEPQQNRPTEPVGAAAAEAIPTMGVAASRPAGAALAPGKQHRMRSILIKVGAVVGVGAAVGATVALSEGSPGRPPGTH